MPLLLKSQTGGNKIIGEQFLLVSRFKGIMVLLLRKQSSVHVVHSILGSRPVLIMSRLQEKSIFKIIYN